MRKAKLLLLFTIFTTSLCSAQQLKSSVDERFELTSIIFRLAGAPEYQSSIPESYITDIDTYFASYKDHPLILYTQQIRAKYGISYDAVPSFALVLQLRKGKVSLDPKVDISRFLEEQPRWKEDVMTQYVKLLNAFYQDTKFKTFFNRHQSLYKQAEVAFDQILQTVDTNWYESFYGKPFGKPAIYVSLSNGGSNYAMSFSYAILVSCANLDSSGTLVFAPSIINTLVHEITHNYSDTLIEEHKLLFIEAANKMYPHLEESLTQAGYRTSTTLLTEGFNRLFTNMYFREHPADLDKLEVEADEYCGFIWMRSAMKFMDNFYANRALYPHIEDFIPQLAGHFSFMADDIETMLKEYALIKPRIISIYPTLNSLVDSNLKELKIEFSRPMSPQIGFETIQEEALKSAIHETREKASWSEDQRTLTIPVNLDRGSSYGIALRYNTFRSVEMHYLTKTHELRFKTRE